jgi:hypothetical protein
MTSPTHISPRIAAFAAIAAAVALAVGGVIQITDAQSGQTTVVGIEHVTLGALTATLLLLAPVTLFLGRAAGRIRPAAIAATGMVVLAALTLVSNVRGEDPSFFAAVAIPTNLMWFGGLISLAVALKRTGAVPAKLAVALPLTWVLALPFSAAGGGLVAGAYWLLVGWLIRHGELPQRRDHALPAVSAA